MTDETTHVRIYESDKEWLESEFEDNLPSSIGRLIERYKGEHK